MTTTTTPVEHPAIEQLRELALIEEKVVLGYSLADAIREGCSVTAKQENGWVQDDRDLPHAHGRPAYPVR